MSRKMAVEPKETVEVNGQEVTRQDTMEQIKEQTVIEQIKDQEIMESETTEQETTAIKFTPAQQACIDERGKDILVSAAAGSGKTAVLVERIIQLILDPQNPVDIDELLVVTFTKAAAAQMKEKVAKAVAKRLEQEPGNEHLERQAALVHNAQITTIDSFCTFVIRNNFGDIDLDPGFRVGDEGEMKLLKQDVLENILEACYEEENSSFMELAECFSNGTNDNALGEIVLKLYDVAMSYPFPEQWLQERVNDYDIGISFEETAWYRLALKQMEILCESGLSALRAAQKICETSGGPYMYGEMIDSDIEQIEHFQHLVTKPADYATLQGAAQGIKFTALSRKKDDTVDPASKEKVKELRQAAKDSVSKLKDGYLLFTGDRIAAQTKLCKQTIEALIDVVMRFSQAFSNTKREKNILDFNDIEHMALQILIRPMGAEAASDSLIIPHAYERTETAKEYARHFKYVMIDEYQDSNLVQEFLLESISGDFDGNPNRFMVGDVKQSIYKFRLAKPEIFLDKYSRYTDGTEGRIRIDLQQNFRSRKEVVDAVNFIFEKIMRKELGGIDYDERAKLNPGAVYPETGTKEMQAELLLFCNQIKVDDEAGENASGNEYREKKRNQTGEGLNAYELEAYGIANRIHKLIKDGRVTDEDSKQLRPVRYKDIVILVRSMSNCADILKNTLESQGIPVYVASKSGYFGSLEVRTLIHLLKIINNPLQDIPFYGVLHSFLTGMTEEEIALIRSLEREKADTLYGQCLAFVEEKDLQIGIPKKVDNQQKTLENVSDIVPENESKSALENESQKTPENMLQNASENILGIFQGAHRKLQEFLYKYQNFREVSKYQSIYELMRYIMAQLDYRTKLSAMPMGDKRLANIDIILQKATDFEQTSFAGLYDFIRYLELLERYEIDYGEANTLGEQADVVRIMTMHASKGLEFPICFVSCLSKNINMRDIGGDFIIDSDYGIGMKCRDVRRRTVSETLRKTVIKEQKRQSNLAEELRVLYVALTRAKEKLIMTAHVSDDFSLDHLYDQDVSLASLLEAKSMLHMILMAVDKEMPIDVCLSDFAMLQGEEAAQLVSREILKNRLRFVLCKPDEETDSILNSITNSDSETDFIRDAITENKEDIHEGVAVNRELWDKIILLKHSKYAYENLQHLHTKTSVSELKKAAMQETDEAAFELFETKEIIPYLPKFLGEEEKVSGTVRGNAYHKFMELFDFTLLSEQEADIQLIDREIERMLVSGKLSKEYANALWKEKLVRFCKSSVAQRMAKAKAEDRLYREQPFVLGIPASRLDPMFPGDETVLIQGIIDVFFEENGEYILLDYKTDKVDNGQQLIDRYKAQMDYYQESIVAMKGKVAQKIIYSFALGEEIML